MDSVSSKYFTTFRTALCSTFDVIIVFTFKSLTADINTMLSDSVPQEVKYISDVAALN